MVAGRYELRAVLGRGGMGVVWLAEDDLLRREVAVKEILWPSQLDDSERETLRRRALREARTAARLAHPHIVRIFDVVDEDGAPWIVMELASDPSLREMITAGGPLPPARAAQIGLQILHAIRAAHAAGVLHRDVKPGNVLFGHEGRAILTDFGMAIADGNPALTTSGLVIGSPAYMAPERARGEPATPAGDLWSLGATLYAMVEGRPPFRRDGAMAVLTAIATAEPDPPRHAGPLWPLISGLLRKNPAERLGAAEAEVMLRSVAEAGVTAATWPLKPAFRAVSPAPAVPGGPGPPGKLPSEAPVPEEPPTVPQSAFPGPEPALTPRNVSAFAELPAARAAAAAPQRESTRPPAPAAKAEEPLPMPLRRRRSRRLAAAATALALAAVIATGLTLLVSQAPQRRPAAGQTAPHAHRPHSPAAAPHGHSASASPSPAPSAAPSAGVQPVALQAGFRWYHDPTGFSIGMPRDWQVSHRGGLVYFIDPGGNRFLFIQQSTQPKPDPLADWRQQLPYRKAREPGFRLLRLARVHYPQAEQAADMEFTFYQQGQLTHVLNRNILVNSHQAYALYWSTPQSQWAASYHLFQGFATTFRPAGSRHGD